MGWGESIRFCPPEVTAAKQLINSFAVRNLYSEDELALWHGLGQLALLIWFAYEAAELVFYDYVDHRLFWNEAGEHVRPGRVQAGAAYKLNPTAEAEKLRKRVFSFYRKKLSDFSFS